MTLRAPSAAPPNALRMWTDGYRIYVELPGLGPREPYIQAYDYTEAGLSKALAILGKRRANYDYTGHIPASYLKPTNEPGTHNQRAAAEATLRRLGIVK